MTNLNLEAKEVKQELIDFLLPFSTPERYHKFKEVLQWRSRWLTVVLEDIFQPHNASAVLRSCDCFGVQDVHIVENKVEFNPNSHVAMGADQWLTLYRYEDEGTNNMASCYEYLRQQGYSIAATTPHNPNVTIAELPIDRKLALVFGTELRGLSDWAIENADYRVAIPMLGFTESFNISVSASLFLYELTNRLHREREDWRLSEAEHLDLMIDWLAGSIRAGEQLVAKFMSKHP
ncbi:tRNA/rRNA methyltransferase (SpoU) [Thalassoporum mexicanum PCC 7367]|uniref:TrmH family RNA methyltransferase n=1 Tax=Thalassoporum mexicanum TaxID=3457544 RepID=UPI00029F98CC|nr:RNA methyltransferase [Pseudanabaena sp. PCC 7367]AFY68795.1 tRNA/rRNA methyltransferase (SpoU) [Pseudanabaena sp. PCC 7367]